MHLKVLLLVSLPALNFISSRPYRYKNVERLFCDSQELNQGQVLLFSLNIRCRLLGLSLSFFVLFSPFQHNGKFFGVVGV